MKIRPATVDDAATIAAIYAPFVEETTISFEEVAPSEQEMQERIAALLPTHPYLVAEIDGTVIGYAYASPHRLRSAYRFAADVSVYVGPDVRRAGAGRALYTELLERLRIAGMHRAYAGIALPNAASIGLHTATGFRHLGTYNEVGFKFGRWHDVSWWELDLGAAP